MTLAYILVGVLLVALLVPALLHAARLVDRGCRLQAVLMLFLSCLGLLMAFGCMVMVMFRIES